MGKRYIKAGIAVCLFLCAHHSIEALDQWKFDKTSQQAYELVIDLQFEKAYALIPKPQTTAETYVVALGEALELLLEEDGEKYTQYQENFELRKDRKTKLNAPDDLFLQAEIIMQWAFIYFKFGHEFDAALNLREAYMITTELKKRYPSYQVTKKTSALLEIIIGSVPEKYNWVLGLLNIEGSIDNGIQLFESMHISDSPLKLESDLLYSLAKCYVLQQVNESMNLLDEIIARRPDQPLPLFLGASVAIKNSQAEKALRFLNKLDSREGFRIDYADYLKGEIFLYKGEYLNSITSYRSFLNHYKGQNNIKDANYKIGMCYWLNGNANDALSLFKIARTVGKEVTEADKYAARSLAEDELPHQELTKARYFTDGGFFKEAGVILDSISQADTPTQRDQVELQYRKGRLAHKTGNLASAKKSYQQVIDLNGSAPWYYAPNACLQLGYLYVAEGDKSNAEEFFEMALSYKKHEYKNSIDSKARSAIAQLKRK